ncbi:MAG TPA: HDOD domain-containing protein, partial [Candidatus Hydrogenedentes bacterium]|nr:HDOD domain-containing protein [Candidatus Hydrogenedentota bacterium]
HRIYPSDLEVIGLNDVGTSSVRSLCNRAGRTNAQLAKHTITRIRELATLPVSRHTKGRFAMLKGVGGMNSERAAAVLSRDPVALAKILAEANAREWTRRTPVVDRHDAIAALGMRRVIETLSALTTCDEQLRYVETCFTQWRENAVSVAETALNIAKNYANVAAPGVYEAALLHNIGSLVFLMLETAEYPSVFDTHPTKLRRDRESELFGIDAAEAGAELADAWGLPTSVINTIRYLHTPESAPNAHDTVAVTALAHNIVQMERSLEADCTEALRILGLTPTALRNTVLRIHANTHADAVEI